MRTQYVAVDFDHTLWDNANNRPMEGAQDAIDVFHGRGIKIIVHSCNNPAFIRQMCEEHSLRIDAIWGEDEIVGKPIAVAYLDDRGILFTNWPDATQAVLEMARDRPLRY